MHLPADVLMYTLRIKYCPLSDCLFYCTHKHVDNPSKLSRIQGVGSNAVVDSASTSIAVDFGTGVIPIAISVGYFHTCAITNGPGKITGSLYCWEYNVYGELGTANQVYDCIQC
jgi:Regulator of chromosome condensation (RCC1) repeat